MITSNRTTIRPLERNDFDGLVEMYLEPDSNKYIKPLENKPTEFYLNFLDKKLAQNKIEQGFWVVELNEAQEVIGTVNLNFFEPFSIYHIGCHLKRAFWNQGYASEILKEIITYGKSQKLEVLHGIVQEKNVASVKMLQRMGFEFLKEELLEGVPLHIYQLKLNEEA